MPAAALAEDQTASVGQPRLDVAAIVLTAGGQDQVGAFKAKAFRGVEADTPRRARNHQDLAVESPHLHRHTLTTDSSGRRGDCRYEADAVAPETQVALSQWTTRSSAVSTTEPLLLCAMSSGAPASTATSTVARAISHRDRRPDESLEIVDKRHSREARSRLFGEHRRSAARPHCALPRSRDDPAS
jgi:hypothetical protein